MNHLLQLETVVPEVQPPRQPFSAVKKRCVRASFPCVSSTSFFVIYGFILILVSERLCCEAAMRNSRRRFLIRHHRCLLSLQSKHLCEKSAHQCDFSHYSPSRRHFNAGGIASQMSDLALRHEKTRKPAFVRLPRIFLLIFLVT